MIVKKIVTGILLLLIILPSYGDSALVAVASNFSPTLEKLAKLYQDKTGHVIYISTGSSGKHFAQIQHGAPYDLFFSADLKRPQLLQQSRFPNSEPVIYAIGQLVYWQKGWQGVISQKELNQSKGYLAIANPQLAPYGLAADEIIRSLILDVNIVTAENVGQVFTMIRTGAANGGFVALSQLINQQVPPNEYWVVPESRYSAIHQSAILLTDSLIAADFLEFVTSDAQSRTLIQASGYLLYGE